MLQHSSLAQYLSGNQFNSPVHLVSVKGMCNSEFENIELRDQTIVELSTRAQCETNIHS